MTSEIIIFESDSGQIDVRLEAEMIWLTQRQLADLFQTSSDNVSLHLKSIYAEGELVEPATTEDYSVVQQEGARKVRRKLRHYNLDVIIALGYRVNSRCATRFRVWATHVLKNYLTRGYALDRERLRQNAQELEAALQLVRRTLAQPDFVRDTGSGLADGR